MLNRVVSRNCSYVSINAPLYYLYFACSAGHCLTLLNRVSCIWIPLLLASKKYCLVYYPKLLKGKFSGFVYYNGWFWPFLASNFDSTILSIPSLIAGLSSYPKIDLFLLFYYKGNCIIWPFLVCFYCKFLPNLSLFKFFLTIHR